MRLLDVNILLAAAIDDHQLHDRVRPWFDGVVAGPGAFGVPTLAWSGLFRLATNRRVFAHPADLGELIAFAEATRRQPNHRHAEPGERHWQLFVRLCRDGGASGNLLPDAYFAAIAMEHGATWVTLDRGFRRWPGVEVEIPEL